MKPRTYEVGTRRQGDWRRPFMVASVVATGVGLSIPWGTVGQRLQPPASRSKPVTVPAPTPHYDFEGAGKAGASTAGEPRRASTEASARLGSAQSDTSPEKPGFVLQPAKGAEGEVKVAEARPAAAPVKVVTPAPAAPIERFPATSPTRELPPIAPHVGPGPVALGDAAVPRFSSAVPGFAEIGDGVYEVRTESSAELPRQASLAQSPSEIGPEARGARFGDPSESGGGNPLALTAAQIVEAPAAATNVDSGVLELTGFEQVAATAPEPVKAAHPFNDPVGDSAAQVEAAPDYRVSVAYSPEAPAIDPQPAAETAYSVQLPPEALSNEEAAIAFGHGDESPFVPADAFAIRDEPAIVPAAQVRLASTGAVGAPVGANPFAEQSQVAQPAGHSIPVVLRGVNLGPVPIRVGGAEGIAVSLGGLLALVRPQMDPAQYIMLSASSSARDYVGLEQLRAAGFSVAFDNRTDSLVLAAR